jgi:Cys-tRNA(Pro)/Cys-tRNA(Cys) deacylase
LDGGGMSKITRATLALEKLGVKFTLHSYEYDADSICLQAAEALGNSLGPRSQHEEARRVVWRQDREDDAPPRCRTAEWLSCRGISPLAQKKRVPVAIDQAALGETSVYLNGGQRGLQIEVSPDDAIRAIGATTHALTG